MIDRWFLDANYFAKPALTDSDVNSIIQNFKVTSNGSVAVSVYSLLGFDDATFKKSIPKIADPNSLGDFGTFPAPNSDRPSVLPFAGWGRWTNQSHVVKLGMIWTFPVAVNSKVASLHLSVEPGILWRYVDLYNHQDFAPEILNEQFYLMNSELGPDTLSLLNNVSFSRVETALSNMAPIQLVLETPVTSTPDTSETSNVKLAWLTMSDNTWVVMCNTSVAVKTCSSSAPVLQATAFINTSLFFDYARNHPDPYQMTHINQYKLSDLWSDALHPTTLSYYPLGFSSNYSYGKGANDGERVFTQGQLDCIACDTGLQGQGPCDGCGGRFEVFNYSGCYVADGNDGSHPASWTGVSSSTSPFAGRKVIGCDARVIPFGVPAVKTSSCSPTGYQGKVVLQPGGGFRAFIEAGTFTVTVGAGLCVTPTPDPRIDFTVKIPDLVNQNQKTNKLCSDLMRFYYDAKPAKDILVSVPIQYPTGKTLAVSWFSVKNNQWNPVCTILPIAENSIWLSIPVSILTNPDFANGAQGCADVTLATRKTRCDGLVLV